MKRQSGYSGFPTVLLTFSLLLVVLAAGFVLGRVVVARAYLNMVPKFDTQAPGVSGEETGEGRPGRVYLPPPVPPAQPPEEEQAETRKHEAENEAERGGREPESEPQPREPAEQRSVEAPQPEEPSREVRPPEPEQAQSRTYSIQVGVFTSRGGARQVVDELARAGFPSRITLEQRGNQELYRVVTGRYRSEYAARKALDQLRSEGFEAFLVQE